MLSSQNNKTPILGQLIQNNNNNNNRPLENKYFNLLNDEPHYQKILWIFQIINTIKLKISIAFAVKNNFSLFCTISQIGQSLGAGRMLYFDRQYS